jgi:anti-sigma B factor antagonist
MELSAETVGGVTVVTVQTDFLDANNSRPFKDKILELLNPSSPHMLLDLTQVQFIDSTGCGALLACLRRVTEVGGEVKLCCITSPVRALFDLVRMSRILEIYKTRAEALQSFRDSGPH